MPQCPLLLAAVLARGSSSTSKDTVQEIICIKNQCAWWTATGGCAVLRLADSLKNS